MSSLIHIRWICGPVLIFVSIYVDKVHSMYTNSLERKAEDCSILGTFCGSHSFRSCHLFCAQRGYISGSCDRSCCTCQDGSKEERGNEVRSNQVSSFAKYDYDSSSLGHFDNDEQKPSVCTSSSCVKTAHQLKENMNLAVDPCDNFYEFACGNFIARTNIPSYKSRVTMFTIEEQKVEDQVLGLLTEAVTHTEPRAFRLAKEFYKSCINTDLIERLWIEPLKNLLIHGGGWPVISQEPWKAEEFHWTDSTIRFRSLGFPDDIFFKFSIRNDGKNSLQKILTIGEPTLGLSTDIFQKGLSDARVKAYFKYQVNMAILLGAQELKAEKEMRDVLELEQNLANIMSPVQNSAIAWTVSQLQLHFSSVNWLNLFRELLHDSVHIDFEDTVLVESPKYIERLLHLLSVTPVKTLSNYVGWKAVASSSIYLSGDSRRIYSEFSSVSGSDPLSSSRSSECIEMVSNKMENAVGSMFIRRYFNKETKTEVQDMVNDIRRAFIESLNSAEWMDLSTLEKAKEKAWAIYSQIGYPLEHLDDDKIDNLYEKLNIKENSYFKNILAITRVQNNREFRKISLIANKTDWTSHGNNAVANAFYHSQENSIVLPAGILQGHFFGIERPSYMNYGSIGWIIGHEISHGFDIKGHMYDKNGNYRNWWDDNTKRAYETKTECFVKQYEKFEVGKEQINGVSSQGENVADNVGIKQAYRGYQSWIRRNGQENGLPGLHFTPNQLFWISAANNWCSKHRSESLRRLVKLGAHVPEEYRVNGAFSNSAEFVADFKCSKYSAMNPRKKCVLW